jgi:hypothetical protein
VPFFELTDDHDGTVPELLYLGESTRTATEHLADIYAEERDSGGKDDTVAWLATLLANGPVWSVDVHGAREQEGSAGTSSTQQRSGCALSPSVTAKTGRGSCGCRSTKARFPRPRIPGVRPFPGSWDSGILAGFWKTQKSPLPAKTP